MFPPLEYNVDEDIEEFKNRVIFRSGQRDLIKRLELLRKQQKRR